MKFSTSIVLASGTITLASMRDHPPQHLARFAEDAIFTHVGGETPAHLEVRHPEAPSGATGGPPALTSAAPAFSSSAFYAPLTFSPSMPDAGYTPPTYAPSTATEVPGSPAGPSPHPSGQHSEPPNYGGWGPSSSSPSSAEPKPTGSCDSSPPAAQTCNSETEIWGGRTFTPTDSPSWKPTGWGWAPPASALPSEANSSLPQPSVSTSTWQTATAPSTSPNAPNPAKPTPDSTENGGGFQQSPSPSSRPSSYQNSAPGLSRATVGGYISLGAVALAIILL